MTYRINDIKVRILLSLNQNQSLCIVTMILSVCFCAINWKATLLVFRLSNSVCRTKYLITCLKKDAIVNCDETLYRVYMNTFWTQLFAYLNGGFYSINSFIAGRFICLLAGERKNSLFFEVIRWSMSQRYIIPSSPLTRCRVCQYWIISRDSLS